MMKKTLILLLFVLVNLTQGFGQPSIKNQVESIDGKHYQSAQTELYCMNVKESKGFIIQPFVDCKYNICNVKLLKIFTFNLGLFTERCELLITFEDKTQLSVCSQNGFNCGGIAIFILCPYAMEKLSTVGVSKIKLKNGYNGKYYTKKIKEDKTYFIDLFESLIKPH